jgi:hypothetical protein
VSALDATQYGVREQLEASLAGFVPPWNLPVDHLSPSSLAMADRCPYQWQQRYIHGRKVRPAEAPVMGTAVHAALERNFRQKIDSHEDIPLVELVQWYMDKGFAETVYNEQESSGEEVQWDTGPESTRQRGKYLVAGYHELVAPRVQPLAVELECSADFGLAVPVQGRIDLERESGTIDWKTGKQKQMKPKEDWRYQALVYTEAKNKPIEFHSISASVKTNAVTIVTPLESEALLVDLTLPERAEMRRTMHGVVLELCTYMAAYGPDEPWPTKGRFHTWACDYCGFRPGCPAWRTT